MNEEEARRLLLVVMTLSCGLSFGLNILGPSVALVVFTYMYNDLGGADDTILRNILNACGLLSFGAGATAICGGSGFRAAPLTPLAYGWFVVVAAVITTTVSVQDLEDCEGDRARGRKTMPLILGDEPTRYILSALIIAWTTLCPIFWNVTPLACIPSLLFGVGLVLNLLRRRHLSADKVSWRLWCVWMMVLYSLPCLQGDLRTWLFNSINPLLGY